MSLRFRLIGLVCLVLLISLALGGGIGYSNASRSVRTEMRAALLVRRQTIENAIEQLQTAREPLRDLGDLVASFKGNRHLRIRLSGEAAAAAAPAVEKSALGGVPGWFVRVLGVRPERAQIPVAVGSHDYGMIVIETDPYNETREVWNEFTESLVTPAVFCGLTIILIYVFIGRTLRPLDRLVVALEEIGDGRYRTRLSGRLTPELARLRDSFNRMAGASSDERCGEPAAKRTAAEFAGTRAGRTRSRSPRRGRPLSVCDQCGCRDCIPADRGKPADPGRRPHPFHTDAARHMQRQVRGMLGRLRPIGLAEFGLTDTIENLVAFWQRRRPEIQYEVTVSAECEGLGDAVGTTICRVVQEAVSNAVRHAEPKVVATWVERGRNPERGRDEVTVTVADNGQGMREPGRLGYGLIGVSERVGALGGQLSFANTSGGGFRLIAVLPYALPASVQPAGP